MKTGAVIVAAGEGKRMGGEGEKLFLRLDGRPLLAVTLLNFQKSPEVDRIVLVVNQQVRERYEAELKGRPELSKVECLVEGGARRQDSVYNGLCAFSPPPELVMIHDGDRPFISPGLIKTVQENARPGGAIAAVPARDTVKWINEKGTIVKTLDREMVWLAQTPQCFEYEKILAAHRKARQLNWKVTDDATLIERSGGRVAIVRGSYDNIKITVAEDWELAKSIYKKIGAKARV